MGVQERDWCRDDAVSYLEPPHVPVRRTALLASAAVVCLAGAVAAFALPGLLGPDRELQAGPLFGPTLTVQQAAYPFGDDWHAYLADERTCPGGEDERAPLAAQAQTMVCLINFARARAGLPGLTVDARLSHAARLKSDEIQRCRVFAHAPCGGEAEAVARAAGYHGSFGENLYIADGRFGAPRVALDGWLNSQGHRENLFRPEWRVHSLYVVKLERFAEYRGVTLWVSHFGDR